MSLVFKKKKSIKGLNAQRHKFKSQSIEKEIPKELALTLAGKHT